MFRRNATLNVNGSDPRTDDTFLLFISTPHRTKKFLAYSIENPQQKIELIKSLWFRASFENHNKISNLQKYRVFQKDR